MQDIRGATVCKICGHGGSIHAVGFFCIAEGCTCGHTKPDDRHYPIHQQHGGIGGGPCKACAPIKNVEPKS